MSCSAEKRGSNRKISRLAWKKPVNEMRVEGTVIHKNLKKSFQERLKNFKKYFMIIQNVKNNKKNFIEKCQEIYQNVKDNWKI